ncbi:MAG: hypothetical protein M1836_005613 [Candelina mexicana]|nr:MAG: hypothetical protein M1836_005613 [Candelina mexicana]
MHHLTRQRSSRHSSQTALGLEAGRPAGLTVSGTVSPLSGGTSDERISGLIRGAKDFLKDFLTLMKDSAGGRKDQTSPLDLDTGFTLGLDQIDCEVEIPENINRCKEPKALTEDELEKLPDCLDIEIYTQTNDTIPMKARIDTCSDCNFIRRKLVLESGVALESYDGPEVAGINGAFTPTEKVVIRVHFKGSCRTRKIEFLITPQEEVDFDMLLGKPFWQPEDLIRIKLSSLTLQLKKESPEQKAERERKALEEAKKNEQKAAQEAEERRRHREWLRSNAASSSNSRTQQ